MSRLRNKLLPTETIRWIAESVEEEGDSQGHVTEIAVLDDAVAWCQGETSTAGLRRVSLNSIDFIDAEECDNTVSLQCGGQVHRIEEITGGSVADFARASGRPARIWRRCNSPTAESARRWRQERHGLALVILSVLTGALFMVVLHAVDAEATPGFGLPETLIILAIVLCSGALMGVATGGPTRALAHLFAGRLLPEQHRKDFICTLSSRRWDGAMPEHPGPLASVGPLERWAMRRAYGAVPTYEPWEPEIVNAPDGLPEGAG